MPNPGSHVQRTPVRAELRSTAFSDHTTIPERYSYDGGNVSPPLEWHGIPDDAAELVLLCEDQDAPGGVFTHWVLTGIAPATTGVGAEAAPPRAVAGRNDFGEIGWSGPRPPQGDSPHRYFFRLYALDQALEFTEETSADVVRSDITDHVIASGTLVGLFAR
ncbi:YbhB/YbcL family Raf kinase inhibitor-like protein [Nocardia sp. NPDC005998]|uniref:YbhB/YbcL family Raf kinase inhibitor-like protein n=1 Tax=Nocardia sp. NPDC005998 TaxID=3156894 RepID=UPI0033B383A3